eukprot:13887095-Ditylum_brightwellii.AAC.1
MLRSAELEANKRIKAGKRNALDMAHLTMVLVTEVVLNKVIKGSTTQWHGGVASKLIDLLKEEYQPNDQVAAVERKGWLVAVKMNKQNKLAKLFEQIAAIENQFSCMAKEFNAEDQIAVLLEKVPNEIQYGESDDHGSSSTELMLAAVQGLCYLCKEKGHRANQYTNKGKGEQSPICPTYLPPQT